MRYTKRKGSTMGALQMNSRLEDLNPMFNRLERGQGLCQDQHQITGSCKERRTPLYSGKWLPNLTLQGVSCLKSKKTRSLAEIVVIWEGTRRNREKERPSRASFNQGKVWTKPMPAQHHIGTISMVLIQRGQNRDTYTGTRLTTRMKS